MKPLTPKKSWIASPRATPVYRMGAAAELGGGNASPDRCITDHGANTANLLSSLFQSSRSLRGRSTGLPGPTAAACKDSQRGRQTQPTPSRIDDVRHYGEQEMPADARPSDRSCRSLDQAERKS